MGQIITGKKIEDEATLSIVSGGKKRKAKIDITIIEDFDETNYRPQVKAELKSIVASIHDDFMINYIKEAKGAENVTKAQDTYALQLKKARERLKQLITEGKITQKEADTFLQNLKNYFALNISVKEYQSGSQFGFHGGTLGANLTSVVENINKMSDTGGLSKVDEELLYFGIANCSPEAVAYGLKGSIEAYLAGAAALIMFDEGFTVAENFMQRMQAELQDNFGGPTNIHLFSVNGKIVPAYVVCHQIATNLSEVGSLLDSELQNTLKNSGNYVNINNNISTSNIPIYTLMPDPQDRWDTIKNLAESTLSGSNISFIFLAGLMDILNTVPDAYKI